MTMQDHEYREPLVVEEDGTYITISQMQLFLNEDPSKSLGERFDEWLKYYNLCRLYNMIFDAIEWDPNCGYIYWDATKEIMSASYPEDGELCKQIDAFEPVSFDDETMQQFYSSLQDADDLGDEEEDDEWGLFHGEN
jgi:hypothetical protein